MDETTNLLLPYILAAQAQKHVTHNEALRTLDALVQLAVVDRDLDTPPAAPDEGARYIVGASPTGEWAGHARAISAWQDGAWAFYAPRVGWIAWVQDEDLAVAWDGASWTALGGGSGSFNPTPLIGINAIADLANRLSLNSPASLFNHEGNGHQIKVNKAAASDTASLLFQTAFSGRAEMGTAGSDDFSFKVSPDGSNWFSAIVIDRADGSVSFPNSSVGGQNARTMGKETIAMPAGAMVARTTNGAALATAELATNAIMLRTFDFDAITEEGVGFVVPMPKSWDEGAVSFQPIWTADSGAGGVVFEMAARAFSDDDALDQAVGGAVTSTDTLIAANDCHIGPESSALTIAGTPAESDLVYFQITRKVADAGDTLAADAKLIGVRLYFTTNAGNDA